MMRRRKSILITIIGLQFQLDEGAKHRINSFINSYRDNGFEVDVLLFYPLSSLPYLFKKKRYLNSNANWILYPSFTVEKFKFLSYFTRFFSQIILATYSRIRNYDLIQSELSANIGRFRNKKIKYIVDFHGDLYSETIFRYNNKETWRSKNALKDILLSLRIASHVILVSEKLKKQIELYSGNHILNYSIISCGVDINRFFEADLPSVEIQIGNKIVLGYCGGLQKWQNIEIVLDTIINLNKIRDDIFFLLITNDDISIIQNRLNCLRMDSYKCIGVKSELVPSYLKLLDVGFLIRDNIPLNIVSSPTKIVEYLAAGVPIICTKYSGDYERSIIDRQHGFILKNIAPSNSELNELSNYLDYVKYNRDKVNDDCVVAAQLRSWVIEFNLFMNQINLY